MSLKLSLQLSKTCQRHIRINKFPIASSDLTRFLLLFLQYFKHLSKVRATGLQLVKWWLDRWIIIEEFTGRAHSYYYLAALSAPSLSRLSITDDSVKYTLGKLQGAKIYLNLPSNFVYKSISFLWNCSRITIVEELSRQGIRWIIWANLKK